MSDQQIVDIRNRYHHKNAQGFEPIGTAFKSTTIRSAIRGLEQQMIDKNGGAIIGGGTW